MPLKRSTLKQYDSTVLLGPDGEPIPPKLEVPFIQWQPDGTSVGRSIDRGPVVYAQAKRFMDTGGRYAFIITEGKGELVAGYPLEDGEKGEMLAVADETVPDGPEIGAAIDRLVAASVANMGNYTFTGVSG